MCFEACSTEHFSFCDGTCTSSCRSGESHLKKMLISDPINLDATEVWEFAVLAFAWLSLPSEHQ